MAVPTNPNQAFAPIKSGTLPQGFSIGLPDDLAAEYKKLWVDSNGKQRPGTWDPNYINKHKVDMTVSQLATALYRSPKIFAWIQQQYGSWNGKKWPQGTAAIDALKQMINATNNNNGGQAGMPMFSGGSSGATGVLQGMGGAGKYSINNGLIQAIVPTATPGPDALTQAGITSKVQSIWSADEHIAGLLNDWGFTQIDAKATARLNDHIYQETIAKGVRLSPSQLQQIVQDYKDPSLGKPLYDVVFDGLKEAKAAGYVMNENDYNNFKNSALSLASAFGISTGKNGFMSPKEIGDLVRHGVALPELTERVQYAYSAMKNADPEVKKTLQQYYGVTDGQLLQYYLHPEKGTKHLLDMNTVEKQVASAQIGGFAKNVGLKGLSQGTAEQMAELVKGQHLGSTTTTGPYTMANINAAELTASRQGALTQRGNGLQAPNTTVNTDQLLAAQIGGAGGINQVQAQQAVQTAEQAKLAPFQKGGGYEESAKGVVGAGSASQ